NISHEEQRELSTIISDNIKVERKNNKERASRRNDKGLTKREEQKEELIKNVYKLYEKGYKQIEICEELGVSKGRISQIIKSKKFNETRS
ncbi:MAG: DNA-binding response regulator, partial [Clostridium sp.]